MRKILSFMISAALLQILLSAQMPLQDLTASLVKQLNLQQVQSYPPKEAVTALENFYNTLQTAPTSDTENAFFVILDNLSSEQAKVLPTNDIVNFSTYLTTSGAQFPTSTIQSLNPTNLAEAVTTLASNQSVTAITLLNHMSPTQLSAMNFAPSNVAAIITDAANNQLQFTNLMPLFSPTALQQAISILYANRVRNPSAFFGTIGQLSESQAAALSATDIENITSYLATLNPSLTSTTSGVWYNLPQSTIQSFTPSNLISAIKTLSSSNPSVATTLMQNMSLKQLHSFTFSDLIDEYTLLGGPLSSSEYTAQMQKILSPQLQNMPVSKIIETIELNTTSNSTAIVIMHNISQEQLQSFSPSQISTIFGRLDNGTISPMLSSIITNLTKTQIQTLTSSSSPLSPAFQLAITAIANVPLNIANTSVQVIIEALNSLAKQNANSNAFFTILTQITSKQALALSPIDIINFASYAAQVGYNMPLSVIQNLNPSNLISAIETLNNFNPSVAMILVQNMSQQQIENLSLPNLMEVLNSLGTSNPSAAIILVQNMSKKQIEDLTSSQIEQVFTFLYAQRNQYNVMPPAFFSIINNLSSQQLKELASLNLPPTLQFALVAMAHELNPSVPLNLTNIQASIVVNTLNFLYVQGTATFSAFSTVLTGLTQNQAQALSATEIVDFSSSVNFSQTLIQNLNPSALTSAMITLSSSNINLASSFLENMSKNQINSMLNYFNKNISNNNSSALIALMGIFSESQLKALNANAITAAFTTLYAINPGILQPIPSEWEAPAWISLGGGGTNGPMVTWYGNNTPWYIWWTPTELVHGVNAHIPPAVIQMLSPSALENAISSLITGDSVAIALILLNNASATQIVGFTAPQIVQILSVKNPGLTSNLMALFDPSAVEIALNSLYNNGVPNNPSALSTALALLSGAQAAALSSADIINFSTYLTTSGAPFSTSMIQSFNPTNLAEAVTTLISTQPAIAVTLLNNMSPTQLSAMNFTVSNVAAIITDAANNGQQFIKLMPFFPPTKLQQAISILYANRVSSPSAFFGTIGQLSKSQAAALNATDIENITSYLATLNPSLTSTTSGVWYNLPQSTIQSFNSTDLATAVITLISKQSAVAITLLNNMSSTQLSVMNFTASNIEAIVTNAVNNGLYFTNVIPFFGSTELQQAVTTLISTQPVAAIALLNTMSSTQLSAMNFTASNIEAIVTDAVNNGLYFTNVLPFFGSTELQQAVTTLISAQPVAAIALLNTMSPTQLSAMSFSVSNIEAIVTDAVNNGLSFANVMPFFGSTELQQAVTTLISAQPVAAITLLNTMSPTQLSAMSFSVSNIEAIVTDAVNNGLSFTNVLPFFGSTELQQAVTTLISTQPVAAIDLLNTMSPTQLSAMSFSVSNIEAIVTDAVNNGLSFTNVMPFFGFTELQQAVTTLISTQPAIAVALLNNIPQKQLLAMNFNTSDIVAIITDAVNNGEPFTHLMPLVSPAALPQVVTTLASKQSAVAIALLNNMSPTQLSAMNFTSPDVAAIITDAANNGLQFANLMPLFTPTVMQQAIGLLYANRKNSSAFSDTIGLLSESQIAALSATDIENITSYLVATNPLLTNLSQSTLQSFNPTNLATAITALVSTQQLAGAAALLYNMSASQMQGFTGPQIEVLLNNSQTAPIFQWQTQDFSAAALANATASLLSKQPTLALTLLNNMSASQMQGFTGPQIEVLLNNSQTAPILQGQIQNFSAAALANATVSLLSKQPTLALTLLNNMSTSQMQGFTGPQLANATVFLLSKQPALALTLLNNMSTSQMQGFTEPQIEVLLNNSQTAAVLANAIAGSANNETLVNNMSVAQAVQVAALIPPKNINNMLSNFNLDTSALAFQTVMANLTQSQAEQIPAESADAYLADLYNSPVQMSSSAIAGLTTVLNTLPSSERVDLYNAFKTSKNPSMQAIVNGVYNNLPWTIRAAMWFGFSASAPTEKRAKVFQALKEKPDSVTSHEPAPTMELPID